MKYMLDTNIIIYAKSKKSEEILKRFKKYSPHDMCISSMTLAELEYGVEKSSKPTQNRLALMVFLSNIEVMPFECKAASEYGRIRSNLEKKGQLIGANDMLIAAHAKSLSLTLITNNTREFSRVEGLMLEDWV